jgi:S-adenosyl-L-methionine hydrolase (adenosine-forming)
LPLITLTSDIGNTDYLVSAIKARLMQVDPAFQLADISHEVAPFNYPQAAYLCRGALMNFPPQTFHLILFDLFEKKQVQLILAYYQDQYIICPDNGLLSLVLNGMPDMVIGVKPAQDQAINSIEIARSMGLIVHRIAAGEPVALLGQPDFAYEEKKYLRPAMDENVLEGQIIFIDRFENVVANIRKEDFDKFRRGRKFRIVFKRDEIIEHISNSYADVREGEKLALFNSAGYLEIAINKGNAAGLFGLKGFSEKQLQGQMLYQTVKVYFE